MDMDGLGRCVLLSKLEGLVARWCPLKGRERFEVCLWRMMR